MKELIIIGAGPAGLSAAIYAARQKLDFVVLTVNIGGQTNWSTEVGNYLGFHLLSGEELAQKFEEHLTDYNIRVKENEPVVQIKKKGRSFVVKTEKNNYEAKAVIIASGKQPKFLQVPGEKKLYGRGVTHCATCDAPLYEGKTAVIVGGGNSAVEAAMILEKYAKKIYVLNIGKKISAEPFLVRKLRKIRNLEVVNNARAAEILGDKSVSGINFEQQGRQKKLKADGIFVEIGLIPNTKFCAGLVKLNKKKEIKVNKEMNTSIPGVFAAGDCNDGIEKQIIVAAGEGCVALLQAVNYLQKLK